MRTKKIIIKLLAVMLITISSFSSVIAYADMSDYNFDSGYDIVISDDADLLDYDEEEKLMEKMYELSKYGNVGFLSNSSNSYCSSTEYLAKSFYESNFGSQSGVVFVIDMYNREIYFYTDGKIGDYLTVSYCNVISDNIYKLATKEKYYKCAYKGFDQVNTLMEGRRIAQPMKYISNVFISLCIAMIIAYIVAILSSKSKKATNKEEIAAMVHSCYVKDPSITFTHQTKKYDPPSSSGGGGGHGGGGGGGGHGGGHSF